MRLSIRSLTPCRCDCIGRSFRPLGISTDHPLYIREGLPGERLENNLQFPVLFLSLVGKMTRDARIYARDALLLSVFDDSLVILRVCYFYLLLPFAVGNLRKYFAKV